VICGGWGVGLLDVGSERRDGWVSESDGSEGKVT
jgi:hypothetical protein